MYRMGEIILSSFLIFFEYGSGVDLPLLSGAEEPALDSRFFNDSFFALEARSRARGASFSVFGLKSGLSGEETAGW